MGMLIWNAVIVYWLQCFSKSQDLSKAKNIRQIRKTAKLLQTKSLVDEKPREYVIVLLASCISVIRLNNKTSMGQNQCKTRKK